MNELTSQISLKVSRLASVVAIVALVIVSPAKANASCGILRYQRIKVSRHVYLFQAAEGTTGIVNGNIVAVLGSKGILLVDSGQFPSASRNVLEQLRTLSSAPVRYIVNTHWHGDHALANSVFKEAFPDAEIIAHSFTISEGKRNYENYAETALKQFPLVMADMRKRMESSSSEDERIWMRETLDCAQQALPELKMTRYVPADHAVDDKLEVNLGNLPVVIEHLGVGNTRRSDRVGETRQAGSHRRYGCVSVAIRHRLRSWTVAGDLGAADESRHLNLCARARAGAPRGQLHPRSRSAAKVHTLPARRPPQWRR